MYTYAHLIDISYCISTTSKLKEPFACDLGCETSFPNVTLVYQWYFDDSVCGYIATTYSDVFNRQTTNKKKKTIIVSLRGTRSLVDTYTDIKVDMVGYNNAGYTLRNCGPNCKVHRGFYSYFSHTLANIGEILQQELETDEDYELLILGHSLGGAVGVLLGVHFLDLGYDKMTLVTMGQPLVGNKPFSSFVDTVMGSSLPVENSGFERKFYRVIHKGDVVTTIPSNNNILDSYSQFNNQIYLNCSHSQANPSNEQVVDCLTGDNPRCIEGDFDKMFGYLTNNFLQTHTTYFRSMGLCGIRLW
ncbi:alpha/beta-hydrolase [Yamadazyma tenuis ATCC 10573]|uniref:triacylglycerol lipase n=1 Tax=Candida tenuis (strain ATCC 10573 / BCRC 21748 / CBS 615 / JCM 9827 / NBRC 10315 / NRRL Y-1498 / VKM Y-70) TaxID=590646 RepID=G3BBW0_CANTC|nr:alpha/beta-hydrolase [Yamadazyma tenuis ATCC 10573]EGV60092.1 alpha/beta-hydrolase [Yamadazyma tenuis ATCC 10573]